MPDSAFLNGYSDLPEAVYVEHGSFPPETNFKAHNVPLETIYVEHGLLPPETNFEAHNTLPEAVSKAYERSDAGSTQSDFNKVEETMRIRKRRRMRLVWIGVIIVLIVIGIGLGVGLWIGLKRDGSAQLSQPSGQDGSEPSLSYSSRGAFNGTGIYAMARDVYLNLTSPPTADLVQGSGNSSGMVVFYQHYAGDLRWMSCEWPTFTWRGGTVDEVIAVDAKNGTPLSATNAANGGVLQTHLFYIDRKNFVRQQTIDNSSYLWVDGPLNAMNLKALDSGQVGLKACLYYGPIANADLAGTDPMTGIRLFVASSETTFEQLAWRPGMPQWIWEQSWQSMNGHATPGCYNWAKGQTTYTMFVDLDDNVELYWKDTATVENTATHPINVWTKSSVSLGKVDPTIGLRYISNLWGRLPGSGVHGWNISFEAENTTIAGTLLNEVDGSPPIEGSYMTVWANLPASKSPDVLTVLYQTEGDDITMYTGVPSTGIWNETRLPIPND